MQALLKAASDQGPQEVLDDYRDRLEDEGVDTGFSRHKRIDIPKDKVSIDDLKDQGWKSDMFAVPEPGQSAIKSWRDKDGYHLHDHGDKWLMHQDEHPSMYFDPKEGINHLNSEGIVGAVRGATWPFKHGLKGLKEVVEEKKEN
ncbi:MAG: hypothetical protein ABEN55_11355 [Bradymonadaceae bacterium]